MPPHRQRRNQPHQRLIPRVARLLHVRPLRIGGVEGQRVEQAAERVGPQVRVGGQEHQQRQPAPAQQDKQPPRPARLDQPPDAIGGHGQPGHGVDVLARRRQPQGHSRTNPE